MEPASPLPYCGASPVPATLAWNGDATLAGLLLLATAAAALLVHRARGAPLAALAGLVFALAWLSPLCALSVALFAARSAQHLLVVLCATPLLALALDRRWPGRAAWPGVAAVVFGAIFWFWHLPRPYAATFAADGIAYWAMHLSIAVSALWLWLAILSGRSERPAGAIVAGLVTGIQMGVLGALLTFAPRALYAWHLPALTLPWGLTPLDDQQLGGLLMWVPGGLLSAGVMVAAFGSLLRMPATLALAAALLSPGAGVAVAQGNDPTSVGAATSERRHSSAPVGILTTTEVTTGSGGRPTSAEAPPPDADRRTRVLGPVCRGIEDEAVRRACADKSGR
jgi:putative membrane protein